MVDLLPLREEQPLPVHEVFLPPQQLLLLVAERFLDPLQLVLLPDELLLQPLDLRLPNQDRLLLGDELHLLPAEDGIDLALRPPLELRGFRPELLLDAILVHLFLHDDDLPFQRVLLPQEVGILLPQLLLEPLAEILAGAAALRPAGGVLERGELRFPRLQARLPLDEGELLLLHLSEVRRLGHEVLLDLSLESVHNLLRLLELDLELSSRHGLLLEFLLHVGDDAGLQLLGLDVFDHGDRALLDVIDLLFELLPLRDLRLELLAQHRRFFDVLHGVEAAGPERRELGTYRLFQRAELSVQAVDLDLPRTDLAVPIV